MADQNPYLVKARKKCRVLKDIAYCPDGAAAHRLDVYLPETTETTLPIIFYIHGGGFTMCSKETHRGCALIYARNGFVVFMINYRLAPRYQYPAAFEDVCRAFCWVVENAAAYGGDPRRMVIAGESAGGNLGLALTLATCYERPEPPAQLVWDTAVTPAALKCIAGYLEVSRPQRLATRHRQGMLRKTAVQIARDVSRAYLGRDYRASSASPTLADPLLVLETAGQPRRPFPPVFAAVGTSDILLTDTERLENALTAKGAIVKAYYYPGEPHVFHFMFWRKNARRYWRDAFVFLNHVN